jgi:hypothetical protein
MHWIHDGTVRFRFYVGQNHRLLWSLDRSGEIQGSIFILLKASFA